ncbi:MAG: hypothetical protein QM756_36685 [Polyangiaceae bacterium]
MTQPERLHQNPELWCRHCGQREALPADAAELHRHLRLRLLQLTQAREASEAPLRTFKMLNDAWMPSMLFMLAMSAFQTYSYLASPGSLRAARIEPTLVVYGAVPVAMAFGMLSGWLGMRHVFSQQLKPLLRARPALQPGLAVRCRNCGGDLPRVHAPEVTCGYCGASNLLDQSVSANAAALLEREAQEYHQRMRPWTRDTHVFMAPTRAFYRYGMVGAVIGLVLASAGFSLFFYLNS